MTNEKTRCATGRCARAEVVEVFLFGERNSPIFQFGAGR